MSEKLILNNFSVFCNINVVPKRIDFVHYARYAYYNVVNFN